MRLGAITYEGLPISRGGAHRLPTRGYAEGCAALARFVGQVALADEPDRLVVETLTPRDIPPEPAIAAILPALEARFARERVRRVGTWAGRQWRLPPSDLAEMAESLDRAGPFSDASYAGPSVAVHASWRLTLLDPISRQPLPHQSADAYADFLIEGDQCLGVSRLNARIAAATSAHLFLSLPMESPSPEARGLAAAVQAAFPARLSPAHWKQWRLTRGGDRYVGRRIESLV